MREQLLHEGMSSMKDIPAIFYILLSVFIVVLGQLLIKKGLNRLGIVSFSSNVIRTYLRIFLSPYVISGIVTYILSMFLWLYSLTKVDLSFAYPFLALSYTLILVFSRIFLHERISPLRIIGVFVICLGVLVVSRS